MTASREERVRALRERLEPGIARDLHDCEIDGLRPGVEFAPTSEEALADVVGGLNAAGLAGVVRGGGTRLGLGNPPREADCVISTRGLAGVRRFEPDDGVIEAGAGTSVAQLREAVAGSGWEVPFDAPGADSTVGGVISAAAAGPRNLAWGPVRRAVLGLEVVLASGDRTRCGGRVVKNVTGYDLAKLYTGALGSLGVISGAWIRLQPEAHATEVRIAEFSETPAAMEAGLAASRRSSSRACVLLSPGAARKAGLAHSLAATWLMVVELAGEAAECDADARWAESTFGAASPEDSSGAAARRWIDAAREQLADPPGEGGVRARIGVLSSRLDVACAPLVQGDVQLSVLPGQGLIHASYPGRGLGSEGRDATRRAVANSERASAAAGGSLCLEYLPLFAKAERDVFDDCGDALGIMRALKREFDPNGALNPGRFAGRI